MRALTALLSLAFALGASAPGFAADASTNSRLPTLFLIGDSTVNNSTRGLQGWGKPIAGFFDQSRITVENRARGGRSSRTFLTEGLWDKVRDNLRPGDFLLIQFGHNDNGPMFDNRARASIKGIGEETITGTNQPSGKVEVVHTYGWYLRKYITEAKAKGATPIVLSLVPRNIWKDGKVTRAAKDFAGWAGEAARQEGALFINLNEIVARHYEEAGQPKVQADYFTASDHTHTTPAGAQLNAACVVEGIRSLTNCALAGYLTATTPKPASKQ